MGGPVELVALTVTARCVRRWRVAWQRDVAAVVRDPHDRRHPNAEFTAPILTGQAAASSPSCHVRAQGKVSSPLGPIAPQGAGTPFSRASCRAGRAQTAWFGVAS